MMRIALLILSCNLLFACGIPMGNRVDAKNLQVYYLEGVEKQTAINFAKFWKDNGFVSERKQVLQIEKVEGSYTLKLIEREMYQETAMNIDEQSKLQELERTLEKEVFNEDLTIIITDNTFRPIVKE